MTTTPSSTATRLDGKAVAAAQLDALGPRIDALKARGITPGLVVVRVGEDPASVVYVNNKAKKAAKLGIAAEVKVFDESESQETVLKAIDALNADPKVHAILVQLPLPKHMDSQQVLQRVSPAKDVDGFHPVNLGRLLAGDLPDALPCTPEGIMTILKHYNIPIAGKNAVVVGRSTIVGKPVGLLLLQENATVTYCHSRTADLTLHLKQADIVVAAVGRPQLITADQLKPGAVVIDVGINRLDDGRLVGDVDFEGAASVASAITPVPGGVGPMTIATLMTNTVTLCEAIHS